MLRKLVLCALVIVFAGSNLQAQSAATSHVFPQLADGTLPDGTYYASIVLATNVTDDAANCSLRLTGGLAGRMFTNTFTLSSKGAFNLAPTIAGLGFLQPLVTGYGVLTCDRPVTALAGYLYLAPPTTLLAAATVFPSPPTTRAQLLLFPSARLALALANDTDTAAQYQLTIADSAGRTVTTGSVTVPARTNTPKFVDEMVQLQPGLLGSITVSSSTAPFSVIGLFFSGPVFFSQPATTFGP